MQMKTMSSALLIAGAVWITGSSASIAAPIDASAIRAAADEVGIGETVHCRPFRHWHRWGFGRGCRGGVVIYDRGPRVRFGVREGFRTRAGVTIRGEERSTIRSGTRDGTTVRGSTTIRSGGAGETSPRATTGGQIRTGAGAGAGGGGRMNTAPAGQTQGQGTQGGAHVPGTQGGASGGGSQKQ